VQLKQRHLNDPNQKSISCKSASMQPSNTYEDKYLKIKMSEIFDPKTEVFTNLG